MSVLSVNSDQLWKQLQLEPTAKVIPANRSPEAAVRFQINLNHAPPETSKPSRHKLSQDVPYYDIDPPPGIRTSRIHRISLDMRFCAADNHKRRKTSILPSVKSDDDDEMLDFSIDCTELPIICEPQAVTKIKRARTTPERTKPSASQISLPDLHTDVKTAGQRYCVPNLKRSCSTSAITENARDCSSEDILTLFDAGIRYAIAAPSKRSLKKVEVLEHESLKHLSSVFPAVFSPGHLESVSKRTVFLPTVSHALTQVCGAHARSPTLRSKISELSRRCGTQPSSGISIETQDNISVHLWRSMQAGLFDSDAASRLKPISSGIADMSGAQPEQFNETEMQGCDDPGLDDCGYDFADEDLFESDEPQEWDEIFMEMSPESSQEDLCLMDVQCDMDDMLLG